MYLLKIDVYKSIDIFPIFIGGKECFSEPKDLTRKLREQLRSVDQTDEPSDRTDATDKSNETNASDAVNNSNASSEHAGDDDSESVKKCDKVWSEQIEKIPGANAELL